MSSKQGKFCLVLALLKPIILLKTMYCFFFFYVSNRSSMWLIYIYIYMMLLIYLIDCLSFICYFLFRYVGGKIKPLKQPKSDKKEYDEVIWYDSHRLVFLLFEAWCEGSFLLSRLRRNLLMYLWWLYTVGCLPMRGSKWFSNFDYYFS